MKRNIGIIMSSLVLILLAFYIVSRYHFIYNSACGTGLIGLRLAGIIALLILIVLILFELGKNNTKKAYCTKCSAKMQNEWSICPYCGTERVGGR